MSGASTVNVLIVDDNDKTRAKLVDQLRYSDIRIVGESSFGAVASSWASQLRVDVVIVAIDEPIARALRTVEQLTTGAASWPVIAVSARNDRELMRKAMLAGARDYMILPAAGGRPAQVGAFASTSGSTNDGAPRPTMTGPPATAPSSPSSASREESARPRRRSMSPPASPRGPSTMSRSSTPTFSSATAR